MVDLIFMASFKKALPGHNEKRVVPREKGSEDHFCENQTIKNIDNKQ